MQARSARKCTNVSSQPSYTIASTVSCNVMHSGRGLTRVPQPHPCPSTSPVSLKGLEAFARLRRPCFHLVIAIAATTRKGGPIRRPRYCQHQSTRGSHEVRNGLTIKQVAFLHACSHCTLLSPDHFTTTVTRNSRSRVTGERALAVASARYTCNCLCILPLLIPFTANTCRR